MRKTSNWKWSADFLIGKQLTGARLGILGMGRIGRAVAKLAKPFGMIIHYHNRTKLSSELEMGATYHDSVKSLFFRFRLFFQLTVQQQKKQKI